MAFLLTAALATAICWKIPLNALLSWLIAVTPITLLTYGYDKVVSGSGRTRVPESVLLALTFAGGTAGALIAMALFRHKTVKMGFRAKFWLIVVIQALLIFAYFMWVEPRL